MSYLENAMTKLVAMVAGRIDEMKPFRAYVDGVSGGMVTIRRLTATTAETEPRARMPGYALEADDEVLCLPVNGKPVVIGPVQRGAMAGNALELSSPDGTVWHVTVSDAGVLSATEA